MKLSRYRKVYIIHYYFIGNLIDSSRRKQSVGIEKDQSKFSDGGRKLGDWVSKDSQLILLRSDVISLNTSHKSELHQYTDSPLSLLINLVKMFIVLSFKYKV